MKKLFSILMIGCIMLPLAACAEKEGETPVAAGESETLLSFESKRELFSFYRISIAETTLNTDKNFVTDGESSMKISYHYDVAENKFAKDMVLGFVPGKQYFTKETATDISYYAIDVYNPNGRECEAIVNVGGATMDNYTLKEGWNTLYTYVDRTALYQVQKEALGYYSLTFRGGKGVKDDFYVDNWRYFKTDTPFEIYSYDNSLTKSTVWHDFSSSAETKLMTVSGTIESKYSAPRFHINRDMQYVKTGNSSLKVSFMNKKNGTVDCTAFKTENGTLPNFNGYLSGARNGEKWYISSDVYNAYEQEITLTYTLTATDSAGGKQYSKTVSIPAGSWSNEAETRIYLDDVAAAWKVEGLDTLYFRYEVSGVSTAGCVYVDSLGLKKA